MLAHSRAKLMESCLQRSSPSLSSTSASGLHDRVSEHGAIEADFAGHGHQVQGGALDAGAEVEDSVFFQAVHESDSFSAAAPVSGLRRFSFCFC